MELLVSGYGFFNFFGDVVCCDFTGLNMHNITKRPSFTPYLILVEPFQTLLHYSV